MTISAQKAGMMDGKFFTDGTQLLRGVETRPVSGMSRTYFQKPLCTELDAIHLKAKGGATFAVVGQPPNMDASRGVGGNPDLAGKDVGPVGLKPGLRKGGESQERKAVGHPAHSNQLHLGGTADPRSSAENVEREHEVIKVMVSAVVVPKPGTTAEMAERNLDHRSRPEET